MRRERSPPVGGGGHGLPRDGQPMTVQLVSFVCWPAPPTTWSSASVRIVSLLSESASVFLFLMVSLREHGGSRLVPRIAQGNSRTCSRVFVDLDTQTTSMGRQAKSAR